MIHRNPNSIRKISRGLAIGFSLAMFIFCFMRKPCVLADSTAAQETLTLPKYEAELARLSAAVSKLAGHPEGASGLRQSLPSEWMVVDGGNQYEVSTEWLSSELSEIEKSSGDRKKLCKEVAEELQKMQSEAEGSSGAPVSADADAARRKLEVILSGREYQRVKSDT